VHDITILQKCKEKRNFLLSFDLTNDQGKISVHGHDGSKVTNFRKTFKIYAFDKFTKKLTSLFVN